MPRIYNWIRGEGTTKAQRWGLAGLGSGASSSYDLTAPCPGSLGCPGTTSDMFNQPNDVQSQIADLWSYVFTNDPASMQNMSSSGNTISGWLSQNIVLVGVGLVAVLLLRRR